MVTAGPTPSTLDTSARPPAPPTPYSPARAWGLVLGLIALLLGIGGLGAGATLGLASSVMRDGAYLTSPTWRVASPSHAVVVGDLEVHVDGVPGDWSSWLMGDIRVRATAVDGSEVFLGVAPAGAAGAYLDGVWHHTSHHRVGVMTETAGGPPAMAPGDAGIWVVQASGRGTVVAEATVEDGDWVAVLMPADGTAGVEADVDVGVTAPFLGPVAAVVALVGLVLAATGTVILVRSSRRPAGAAQPLRSSARRSR